MAIERIGVVGAGMMGAEIAYIFALSGASVKLSDASVEALARARARHEALLTKAVEKGAIDRDGADDVLMRLEGTTDLADFADRDMVIEAVFEDQEVKGGIFKRLDDILPADCLIASNTSSISISVLASYLSEARRPNFMGLHFFSPVSRMKLVEAISAFETDPAALKRAQDACEAAGKVAIPVKDVVGFAVNRLLMAFFIEANKLVEEGVATPEDIDTACRLGLGHPVGPFKLLDEVSNPLALQVMDILHDAYGERFHPPLLMKQMVHSGRHGRKAGRGWYDYRGGA
ncbi:3-hydroxyacyl-CoA dehydrogenase family protein [Marivibrio halodurans]|uniref:3-hydroxyacyl-CoA dehydrogenase family protein n=1 Tax=Marivibrio halodurans TaxID=2039722 RepID=A0A8J7V0U5_9PROT|nr:3-hydroxyacyl-CoA dehydrogenase family protein [Marivibrio halodurans]MBP5855416.1 3-hydroxyacyl-CoA dehydrogenase family protein [Marivibrio halodurans]